MDPEDPDIDGDGVANATDTCPVGVIGWTADAANDADGDGCRDLDEDDDDDDGLANALDRCPDGLPSGADYDLGRPADDDLWR